MSTHSLPVFVDGRCVYLEAGATVLDAVRAADPAQADAVAGGTRLITDSRGLPCEPTAPAYAGCILRVVTARARDAESGA